MGSLREFCQATAPEAVTNGNTTEYNVSWMYTIIAIMTPAIHV